MLKFKYDALENYLYAPELNYNENYLGRKSFQQQNNFIFHDKHYLEFS